VGLIGGSFGLALKRAGFSGRIVGVSRGPTLDTARQMGVIDEGWTYEELDRALDGADLVLLCTPIKHILGFLEEIGRHAPTGALITDAGSTKRRIVEQAAQVLPAGLHFVGGHPMAGSEKSGVTAADPFLFQNAIYILTPGAQVPPQPYDALVGLLRSIGAKVLEMDAETHDQTVAAISHLPQLMATGLVEMVGRLHEESGFFLTLAAGGFRDLTRIASSPYAPVWEDICQTNADQIRAMIDRYIDQLGQLRSRVEDASLGDNFSYANRVRDGLPRDAKGFIHTLHEVLVVAEDRPGIIAEMSVALAKASVNINDIEVVKVREGEGGTIRLGFDSGEAAARALEILADLGYQARRR
jgi:prephenate dehydrogenase